MDEQYFRCCMKAGQRTGRALGEKRRKYQQTRQRAGSATKHKMFSFHKPKVYRSTTGCCICKAKSSRYVYFQFEYSLVLVL
nr:uncharacterized protein LOC113827629 isoform X2 [Penaeus vannamei]